MKKKFIGWLTGSVTVMFWLFFNPGKGAFVTYAGVYWVMSVIAMFLSSRLRA